MFIGHPDAGQRSAIIYSIVVSCQRRGIDPHAYLRDVLTRLPRMTTRDDLEARIGEVVDVKSAWVGPKEWEGPDGKTYVLMDRKPGMT